MALGSTHENHLVHEQIIIERMSSFISSPPSPLEGISWTISVSHHSLPHHPEDSLFANTFTPLTPLSLLTFLSFFCHVAKRILNVYIRKTCNVCVRNKCLHHSLTNEKLSFVLAVGWWNIFSSLPLRWDGQPTTEFELKMQWEKIKWDGRMKMPFTRRRLFH